MKKSIMSIIRAILGLVVLISIAVNIVLPLYYLMSDMSFFTFIGLELLSIIFFFIFIVPLVEKIYK